MDFNKSDTKASAVLLLHLAGGVTRSGIKRAGDGQAIKGGIVGGNFAQFYHFTKRYPMIKRQYFSQ